MSTPAPASGPDARSRPAGGEPAIRAEGLGKVYRTGFFMRRFTGLDGLDLEVRRGEIFGFIGPNGAGKTTTIKILMGLHAATSGRAWILGVPHDRPEARRRVGYLPERPYFYEHLTARELLDFYGRLLDMPAADRKARADALLERVGLARAADEALRRYSKGMLQRVGLCQALLNRPDLVVLDEPMSGLDPLGRALVRDLILEEAAEGRTIFYSSHILHDVETLSDRVAILVGGRLRGVGRVSDLLGRQVESVDCTFSGADPVPVPGATLVRSDADSHTLRLPPDAVDGAVRAALDAGRHVLSVQPLRRTLEDALIGEVREAAR